MKKISLKTVSDFLSDNELKFQVGGVAGCWQFECLRGAPCGSYNCPGDYNGKCTGDYNACYDALDSDCTYGFIMKPC